MTSTPKEPQTPEEPDSNHTDSISELIDTVKKFPPEIFKELNYLQGRARSNRRWLILVIIGVFLFGTIGTITAVNTYKVTEISHRINATVTIQRQKALCPLYQVFLNSRSDQQRNALPNDAAKQKYDQAFMVIQQGFDTLECNEFANHLG